ncbi:hypothetical protein [Herbaspirillum sp. SJZ099]|uniref:hypothetical protein n=1 Tax=Herbaspirillum sp. SJZ099 TaxID=2572916 RepID=UPI0011AAD4D9|nr:hypothetical protein [Herbaspirillum sp. SJZ099]TWC65938.1 hypothetical protein FB597_106248 [Herbaspirillum sp. SJZ099]
MRTIYSIDEATELTQLSEPELIALGCSGVLRFLIDVPGDVQIGNVGWGDTEEAVDPVRRKLNPKAFHLTPAPVPKLDLLALSKEDCQKLQARKTLRQAVFFRAAVFGPESELEIIRPSRLEDDSYRLGKLHFPLRVFAAYDRSTPFQGQGNAVVPTKELKITILDLYIAAVELQPYLTNQKQETSPQPLPSPKPTKKGKGITELTRLIKRTVYDPATADEKKDTDVLWSKLVSLAKQASPDSLLRGFDEETEHVLYKTSGGKGRLTRTQFNDRVDRIRLPS